MKSFRATYTPTKPTEEGEPRTVLVIKILNPSEQWMTPKAVFIETGGTLNSAPINCFSDCDWRVWLEEK